VRRSGTGDDLVLAVGRLILFVKPGFTGIKMRLSVIAFAIAAAIVSALCFLFISLLNLILPGYGGRYLAVVGSLYPGYDPVALPLSVILGTLYALLAGGVTGALLAWLYNQFTK
jgi:hypothetical protein